MRCSGLLRHAVTRLPLLAFVVGSAHAQDACCSLFCAPEKADMRKRFNVLLMLVFLPSVALAETAVKRELSSGTFVRKPKHTERFFPRTAQEQVTVYAGASHDFSGVGRAIKNNFQNIDNMCSTWGARISMSLAVTVGHHVPAGPLDRFQGN